METRMATLVALLAFAALAPAPEAQQPERSSSAITVVEDRVYRLGVYLVVDGLVENTTAGPVEGLEASVGFYDFFGQLLAVEPTVLTPSALGPGQVAAVRVVTPFSDAARTIHYRFTWRQNGEQRQDVEPREIWSIGSPTRPRTRTP
jgi:hypothetical protein